MKNHCYTMVILCKLALHYYILTGSTKECYTGHITILTKPLKKIGGKYTVHSCILNKDYMYCLEIHVYVIRTKFVNYTRLIACLIIVIIMRQGEHFSHHCCLICLKSSYKGDNSKIVEMH